MTNGIENSDDVKWKPRKACDRSSSSKWFSIVPTCSIKNDSTGPEHRSHLSFANCRLTRTLGWSLVQSHTKAAKHPPCVISKVLSIANAEHTLDGWQLTMIKSPARAIISSPSKSWMMGKEHFLVMVTGYLLSTFGSSKSFPTETAAAIPCLERVEPLALCVDLPLFGSRASTTSTASEPSAFVGDYRNRKLT